MAAESPQIVVLCRSAPGQDQALSELLDMALTLAVFGQSVALVLVGEGVRYLSTQSAGASAADEPTLLATLEDYGIQAWAEEAALRDAGIMAEQLPHTFRPASAARIAGLIAASRHTWGW